MSSADIRGAAAELNRVFVADLEALSSADWQRPSDCEGWTVAAVVVHQTQVAELATDGLARGRAGDPGPPARAAEGVQAWRTWRGGEQRRRAAQPPAEILAQYRARVADLEQELDRIPTAPADARAWHPAGPQPLDWYIGQWLFELALHDWDIRVSADPVADIRRACWAAFAETLPPRLARGFGGADDPALAGRYRIVVESSSTPLAWSFRVGAGHIETDTDDPAEVDATIRTDPGVLGLVMTNRRPVERFEASGRWHAEGDEARAAAFARAFRSY
jgi:uncharacterized protein (TIGR03083 family)